jgi:hypothetical protein
MNLDGDSSTLRRRAAFRILNEIRQAPISPAEDGSLPVMLFGPFIVGPYMEIKKTFNADFNAILREVVPDVKLSAYASSFIRPSFGCSVPIDVGVPPEVHAVVLLMHQMFGGAWDDSKNRVRWVHDRSCLNFCRYSRDGAGAEWVRDLLRGYVMASWNAAMRISTQWQEKLVELQKPLCRPITGIDCLQFLSRQHLGDWSANTYEPVAKIMLKPPKGEEGLRAYFAVA